MLMTIEGVGPSNSSIGVKRWLYANFTVWRIAPSILSSSLNYVLPEHKNTQVGEINLQLVIITLEAIVVFDHGIRVEMGEYVLNHIIKKHI